MTIRLSDHFTYSRLIRFAIPSIGTMIFTSVYSIVDGYFVSNFAGKTPFAAVNLIMPFLLIMATAGFMFGTGGSAIVAAKLGEGKPEKANEYFSLFVTVTFLLGVVLGILGQLFLRRIAAAMGAEGELLEDCVRYARIVLLSLPFFCLQMLFQSFFVTAEKPKLGLYVTFASGFANMILDAVLCMSLPLQYRLAGAALATAVSEVIGGVVPLLFFGRKNDSLLRLTKPKYDGRAILKACTNGSSEFMSNVAFSIVGILYNLQLLKYAGENGVAAYGVMMYVSMIFSAAFVGYSVGTAPIVSFNQGAENYEELKSLLSKSLKLVGLFGIGMTLFGEILAGPLASLFVGYDSELMALTASGLRIYSVSFLLMGFSIFASSFFTALNDGLTSALISFLRTLVFEVAAVLLLPLILGINGIWSAVIVAELMAVILSAVFLWAKKDRYHYA